MSKALTAWLIRVGVPVSGGWEALPIDTIASDYPALIRLGFTFPRVVYVSINREHCLTRAGGSHVLRPGECELLMELDCTNAVINPLSPEECRRLDEVLVNCPRIISVEVLNECKPLQIDTAPLDFSI